MKRLCVRVQFGSGNKMTMGYISGHILFGGRERSVKAEVSNSSPGGPRVSVGPFKLQSWGAAVSAGLVCLLFNHLRPGERSEWTGLFS